MGVDKPESVPQRFAFINPAAKAFREVFIDSLRGVMDKVHPTQSTWMSPGRCGTTATA